MGTVYKILDVKNSGFRELIKNIRGSQQSIWFVFFSVKNRLTPNRLYHVGPLARIGPNHLLLSDPEAIRKMLAARSLYTRGPWYDSLRIDPHRANLITERDEKKHRVLRQQMAAGVSQRMPRSVHG